MTTEETLYVAVKNSRIIWSTISNKIDDVWKALVWQEFGKDIISYGFRSVPQDTIKAMEAKGCKVFKARIVINED